MFQHEQTKRIVVQIFFVRQLSIMCTYCQNNDRIARNNRLRRICRRGARAVFLFPEEVIEIKFRVLNQTSREIYSPVMYAVIFRNL